MRINCFGDKVSSLHCKIVLLDEQQLVHEVLVSAPNFYPFTGLYTISPLRRTAFVRYGIRFGSSLLWHGHERLAKSLSFFFFKIIIIIKKYLLFGLSTRFGKRLKSFWGYIRGWCCWWSPQSVIIAVYRNDDIFVLGWRSLLFLDVLSFLSYIIICIYFFPHWKTKTSRDFQPTSLVLYTYNLWSRSVIVKGEHNMGWSWFCAFDK